MPRFKAVVFPPPPNMSDSVISQIFKNWFKRLHDRVGEGPFMIQGYSRTSLPTASDWAATTDPSFTSLIWVYNATGGACVAYSDGTNWRRVDTNAIV